MAAIVFPTITPTLTIPGGDMASTWVANLRVHAEEQITS